MALDPPPPVTDLDWSPERASTGVDDDSYLDRLNNRVMTELQIDGRVFPSNAAVHGRTAIRTCIVSYRTEARHLEQLLELTREIGERVHASGIVT